MVQPGADIADAAERVGMGEEVRPEGRIFGGESTATAANAIKAKAAVWSVDPITNG